MGDTCAGGRHLEQVGRQGRLHMAGPAGLPLRLSNHMNLSHSRQKGAGPRLRGCWHMPCCATLPPASQPAPPLAPSACFCICCRVLSNGPPCASPLSPSLLLALRPSAPAAAATQSCLPSWMCNCRSFFLPHLALIVRFFSLLCKCRVVPPRLLPQLGRGRAAREVQASHPSLHCCITGFLGAWCGLC